MAQTPLTLRDHLELDFASDSFQWDAAPPPLRRRTTVRCLMETQLRGPRLLRSLSKGASAVARLLRLSNAASSSHPRRGFWHRNRHPKESPPSLALQKEQLSPVSVMEFPYEDEEQPSSSSPCFHQTIDGFERTKIQLLHRIQRFESSAALDNPASTVHVAESGEQTAPCRLRLTACCEELLLHLYSQVDGEPLRSASRWRRFEEEEEEPVVAAELTGTVLAWLLEELVDELF